MLNVAWKCLEQSFLRSSYLFDHRVNSSESSQHCHGIVPVCSLFVEVGVGNGRFCLEQSQVLNHLSVLILGVSLAKSVQVALDLFELQC